MSYRYTNFDGALALCFHDLQIIAPNKLHDDHKLHVEHIARLGRISENSGILDTFHV